MTSHNVTKEISLRAQYYMLLYCIRALGSLYCYTRALLISLDIWTFVYTANAHEDLPLKYTTGDIKDPI